MNRSINDKKVKISIIVPTMNRISSFKNTVNSILSGSHIPDEVVVVDQSNDGKTDELIKEYLLSKNGQECLFKYVHLSKPSLTCARNIGISMSSSDLIIMSDDDVEIHSDTITNIIKMMKDESISMIAGVNELEGKSKSILGYLLGFKSLIKRNIGHIAPGIFGRFPNKIDNQTNTMWAMGFFFVVRRALLNKWNIGWDEKLISYGYPEDLDFSYTYFKRSIAEGYRCIMSNQVVVKHLNSQEYRIPSRKSTFMYVLHRAYLYKKHNLNVYNWIMFNISNYAMLLKRRIKKESPKDMKDAMKYLKRHKKDIFEGKFYYGD